MIRFWKKEDLTALSVERLGKAGPFASFWT